MITYVPRLATAVPQTLEVRLEIAKPIAGLTAQEEDERRLKRRRAEIGPLRRELGETTLALQALRRECDPRLRSYVMKYSPDQPRVPAGNPDGGRWTRETGSGISTESVNISASESDGSLEPEPQHTALDNSYLETQGTGRHNGIQASEETLRFAARRISPAQEAECEAQYERDLIECRMVGLSACYGQAMLRYSNCLQGLPAPPLNY